MSEFQQVAFRAIDGRVSEKNLEYMEQQSSRAKITPWSFDNEYHYGDFHGNAEEMLRRGYDLHFHYANYGIRKLMIRLPDGLPDAKAAKPYFGKETLQFLKDKTGKGGSLLVQPYLDSCELDALFDIDELVDRLVPLRAEILDGDLRPLYLAHLAMASDSNHDPEQMTEGPVPAGLNDPSDAQLAMGELYGLGENIIAAAAMNCPPAGEQADRAGLEAAWLASQPAAAKDAWLRQVMADAPATVKREMLAAFRATNRAPARPTNPPSRTIAELRLAADEIRLAASHKAIAQAARARAKHLTKMAADPAPTLRETEKLVAGRGRGAFVEAANLLAQLREALQGSAQAGLAEKQALKLKNAHPTLTRLLSELRKQGFCKKKVK